MKFNDLGCVDRITEIASTGNPDYTEICDHILRYCDMEMDLEDSRPSF